MVAGGTNGASVNYVELYSPNGGCNFPLAPLPKQLFANPLVGRYKDKVLVCLGYSDQSGGDNNQCWQYSYATNTWAFLTQSTYMHRWRTPFLFKNFVYFIDGSNPEKYNIDTNQWSAGISVQEMALAWSSTMIQSLFLVEMVTAQGTSNIISLL